MSRNNQSSFMQTVREALGHPGDLPRKAPPGLFHKIPPEESLRRIKRINRRGPTDQRVLIERLQRAAEPIHLEVGIVNSSPAAAAAIVQKVAASQTEWGGPRQVCAWDHPLINSLGLAAILAGHDVPVVSSASFSPMTTGGMSGDQRAALGKSIADSFIGITAADYCVADTATLVIRTRPGQPRSVSLVPSIHIAIITAGQILADFKELYATLRWGNPLQAADLTTCMTFVSGPSKTADIEATLVHGAHGPRDLYLVVIDEV